GLQALTARFPWIIELRGRGLLRGLRIDLGPDQDRLFPEILPAAREAGLLVLRSGGDVVRIAPPLVISPRELERGLRLLETTLQQIHDRRTA
ncbi:MAG: aspartate aminotransferase family protein, partial [Oceanospirillales bacterium]|nr:aspartate aminotransferase family protein [Oceanospirillales bacterium]